jgi:hypothetical protein
MGKSKCLLEISHFSLTRLRHPLPLGEGNAAGVMKIYALPTQTLKNQMKLFHK